METRQINTESENTCSVKLPIGPAARGGTRWYSALRRSEIARTYITRFHTKYQKSDGCWLWQAGIFRNRGYGMVNLGRDFQGKQHTEYAHRVAYVLWKGDIPEGAVVMHSCDVTGCVNPDHLSLGTQADNIADASRKGKYLRGLTVGSVRWRREQRRLGVWPKRGTPKAA